MSLFTWNVNTRMGDEQFSFIKGALSEIWRQLRKMSDLIQRLIDDVAAQTTVVASVKTLIDGNVAQIRDLQSQLADALANMGVNADELLAPLAAVADNLEANTAALQSATVVNTVAEGSPVEEVPTSG